MIATLYIPQQPPRAVSIQGLSLPSTISRFAIVPEQVSALLECAPALVDVLACGSHYIAYSIFDCESEVNYAAMIAVAQMTQTSFDPDNTDEVLCGPVLVVQNEI